MSVVEPLFQLKRACVRRHIISHTTYWLRVSPPPPRRHTRPSLSFIHSFIRPFTIFLAIFELRAWPGQHQWSVSQSGPSSVASYPPGDTFFILPSIFFGRLRAETLCPTPLPSPNIIDYYPSGGDPSHPPPSTLRRSVVDLKSSGAVRVRFFGTPNSVNLCILSSSSLWYIVEVALCYIKKNFFAFRGRFTVCFWRISECAPVFIRPFKKALRDNKISVGGQCAISKNWFGIVIVPFSVSMRGV